MSTIKDLRGHALTGATAESSAAYSKALREFNLLLGDPVASVDTALAATPDFVMAHALKAWLHLLGAEAAGVSVARVAYDAASKLPMSRQEQGHITAIGHLVEGRWHEASRVIEDVAVENPRDILALQAGHQLDFFTGDARMLRDRIARALPAWSRGHAGLPLRARHARLRPRGDGRLRRRREAPAARPSSWSRATAGRSTRSRTCWRCRAARTTASRWMRADPNAWSQDSFFAVHNWWHLALYHLELGEIDEVLALFDGPIYGAHSKVMLEHDRCLRPAVAPASAWHRGRRPLAAGGGCVRTRRRRRQLRLQRPARDDGVRRRRPSERCRPRAGERSSRPLPATGDNAALRRARSGLPLARPFMPSATATTRLRCV